MLWDDFARVGSPVSPGTVARGLSLGQDAFPDPLRIALSHAGVHAEEAADLRALKTLVRERTRDFLICTEAALGSDPEASMAWLLEGKPAVSCPVFLLRKERMLAEKARTSTQFSELMSSGQDSLGYYLMIRATLRRKRPHVLAGVLKYGRLSLDQESFLLSLGEKSGPLTMLEFCVLGAMLDAPRIVWNKIYLNRIVFGPTGVKPGRQFDTFMSRVRRGIRAKIGVDPIVAEHGVGYALSPTVLGAPGFVGLDDVRSEPAWPRAEGATDPT
jgi:hypothetical protein